jgi:excisionase family DNA binding protein
LLYREIKAGRLRSARIGARRDIRIHRDWIDEWLIAASTPMEVRR